MTRVAFLLPVIDGNLYLGQRCTAPMKGMYGAVGGKADSARESSLWNEPSLITKMGGATFLKLGEQDWQNQGLERIVQAATREFCEEVFSEVPYPEGFSESDIDSILHLGYVLDGDEQQHKCEFVLANVKRKDFSLSPRELLDFRPIDEIDPEQIFPITHVALQHIKHYLQTFNLPSDESMPMWSYINENDSIREKMRRWDFYRDIGIVEQVPEWKNPLFYSSNMVGYLSFIMGQIKSGVLAEK